MSFKLAGDFTNGSILASFYCDMIINRICLLQRMIASTGSKAVFIEIVYTEKLTQRAWLVTGKVKGYLKITISLRKPQCDRIAH